MKRKKETVNETESYHRNIVFALGIAAFIIPSLWYPIFTVAMAVIVGAVAVYELIKAFEKRRVQTVLRTDCQRNSYCTGYFHLDMGIWPDCLKLQLALYLLIIGSYCLACGILIPVVRPDDESALRNGLISGGIVFMSVFLSTVFARNGADRERMVLHADRTLRFLDFRCVLLISRSYFGKREGCSAHFPEKEDVEGCIRRSSRLCSCGYDIQCSCNQAR